MKHYYILFKPEADINYLHLFELMDQADYNIETKAYDTISYISLKKLADNLSFSKSTLDRILDNNEYKPFLSLDRDKKIITVKNSFIGQRGKKEPFVMLNDSEIAFLRQIKKNLLCKYLIYIKYYCGHTYENKTDFTANQFLEACGYSIKSQQYKDILGSYNKLLVDNDIVEIKRYIEDGKKRNIYKMKT